MGSAYVEVILGISLGVVVGIVPALAATSIAVVVPDWTDRRYARTAVAGSSAVIGGTIAIGLGIVAAEYGQVPRLLAGGAMVTILSVYGFEQGGDIGATIRRTGGASVRRGRALSPAVMDAVDATGVVTIAPAGEIRSMDGYPALSNELAASIADERFRLPADLPVGELAARIERTLERRYDLAAVDVTVDPRGTATIVAAPPDASLGRQVPDGYRAVTITALIPDGVTDGDVITIETDDDRIEARVLGTDDRVLEDERRTDDPDLVSTDGHGEGGPPDGRSYVRRLTVAVPTARATPLLETDTFSVVVRSRDTRPDFHALSLLDRAGASVRVTILDEELIEGVREDDQMAVFAYRPAGDGTDWTFDPSVEGLVPGTEAILIGDGHELTRAIGDAPVGEEVIEV